VASTYSYLPLACCGAQSEADSYAETAEGLHADWAEELEMLPTTAADNAFMLFRDDVVSGDTLAMFVGGDAASAGVDPVTWFLPFNRDPAVLGNHL
jgi:hypothetical protein